MRQVEFIHLSFIQSTSIYWVPVVQPGIALDSGKGVKGDSHTYSDF